VGRKHKDLGALPPGKKRYPLYRGLGGPQGRSGRVRNILSPLGFVSRTVHPVASRYTDWAIPVHTEYIHSPYNLVTFHYGKR